MAALVSRGRCVLRVAGFVRFVAGHENVRDVAGRTMSALIHLPLQSPGQGTSGVYLYFLIFAKSSAGW